MSITELGALGEFVGSLAVLATLVYLAIQVRQSKAMLMENRKISLAQTYQARASMAGQINMAVDPEIFGNKLGGKSPYELTVDDLAELSETERVQIARYYGLLLVSLDNVFYQARLGLVDNDMPEGGKRVLRQLFPVLTILRVPLLPEVRRICREMNLPVPEFSPIPRSRTEHSDAN